MENKIQNETPQQPAIASMKRLIFLGCGAVAKVVISHLSHYITIDYNRIYIIDIADMRNHPALQHVFAKGANFMRLKVDEDEYEDLFQLLKLEPLDMVVDLLVSSNYLKMIEVCRKMSLLHVNASLELDLLNPETLTLYEQSILKRHDELDALTDKITKTDKYNATHIVEFGMNPGLISHFALKGIIDICKLVLSHHEDKELQGYFEKRDFPRMAKHIGLEVVHISEIDDQVANISIPEGMFVNTWSCVGFLDEGLKPPEVGWGTHEKELPATGELLSDHQLVINTPSYLSLQKSYVPNQEFVGMSIPHGECITIPKYLAMEDYCPTVQYVYQLCPQTRECMDKMSFEELLKCTNFKILEPTSCEMSGVDRVGALLILKKNPLTGENKNWTHWTGSILGQGTSKFFGPTVIQVATGVLVAIKYATMNQNKGALYSENLPSEWVVEAAAPFMGKIVSAPMDWSPESTQFTKLQVKREGAKSVSLTSDKTKLNAKEGVKKEDSDSENSTGESAESVGVGSEATTPHKVDVTLEGK